MYVYVIYIYVYINDRCSFFRCSDDFDFVFNP